jgi:hypothetical protein
MTTTAMATHLSAELPPEAAAIAAFSTCVVRTSAGMLPVPG